MSAKKSRIVHRTDGRKAGQRSYTAACVHLKVHMAVVNGKVSIVCDDCSAVVD